MPILSGSYSKPTWISVNLGGACNSHCKFCYTEWTRSSRDLTTDEVKDSLQRIRNVTDLDSIVITGGEPTIRTDLIEIFQFANELGFHKISLQTHAGELSDYTFLKKLFELGLQKMLVSLHGPNSNIHDKITNSSGSFEQVLQALHNIAKLSVLTTVNVVICNDNYRHLKEIVILLDNTQLKSKVIRFSYPIIEGAAFDNGRDVCVSFPKLRFWLLEAITFAQNKGMIVQTFGIPLCILGKTNTFPVNTPEINSRLLSASVFNRDNIPRGEEYVNLQVCKKCSVIDNCSGIQLDYLRLFPASYTIFSPM